MLNSEVTRFIHRQSNACLAARTSCFDAGNRQMRTKQSAHLEDPIAEFSSRSSDIHGTWRKLKEAAQLCASLLPYYCHCRGMITFGMSKNRV